MQHEEKHGALCRRRLSQRPYHRRRGHHRNLETEASAMWKWRDQDGMASEGIQARDGEVHEDTRMDTKRHETFVVETRGE